MRYEIIDTRTGLVVRDLIMEDISYELILTQDGQIAWNHPGGGWEEVADQENYAVRWLVDETEQDKRERDADQLRIDQQILTAALREVSVAMDALIADCADADGKPKAPSRQAVMRARGLLPPYCTQALAKRAPPGEKP